MPAPNPSEFNIARAAVNMISSVLNNSAPFLPPEDFDWQAFLQFTKEHNISNIIYYAVKGNNAVPSEVMKFFEEVYLRACLKEALLDVEIPALLDSFEKNAVRHMPLKGYIIKRYYPEPVMRSMGDIDILVGTDLAKASEVILSCGYKLEGEAFLHDNYYKAPNIHVELHKSLVDECFDKMYAYYGEGFDKAEIAQGTEYRYTFSDEDYYIFLLAHIAKHFRISGTGIRSIIDVYVYREKFRSLDDEYIDAELMKMDLLKFKNKIEQLAYDWFSKPFAGEFDAVGEYIVTSGVYGKSDNHELNAFILNTFSDSSYKKGKAKYIISMIFPGKEYLGSRYPAVRKHPVLIPFFWVVRFFSSIFRRRGNIRYRLKGVSESDETALKKFDDTGLR